MVGRCLYCGAKVFVDRSVAASKERTMSEKLNTYRNRAEEVLADEFGGVWGEHPGYPVDDWKCEAMDGNTRLGYWAWVSHKIEQLYVS